MPLLRVKEPNLMTPILCRSRAHCSRRAWSMVGAWARWAVKRRGVDKVKYQRKQEPEKCVEVGWMGSGWDTRVTGMCMKRRLQ